MAGSFFPSPSFLLKKWEEFFHGQQASMKQAPEEEGYIRAVPDAGAGKHNQFIDAGPGTPFPAAAQRDVQVVPEPS